MTRAVCIAGAGVLTGAGRGLELFWQAMQNAQPGQAPHTLGDPRFSNPAYVQVPQRNGANTDLATRWLNEAVDDALAAAEPVLKTLEQPRVALLGGSSLGGMSALETRQRRWWAQAHNGQGLKAPELNLEAAAYDGPVRSLAARLSVGGFTLNTACSSAANALGVARRWLLHNRIDVAIVAGFDVISPFVYAGFQALGALDPQPTTPFGAERKGLNLGDAAVAFVLTRATEPEGVCITGYGSSCDAHHLTRPDLGGKGLARAITACLQDAQINANQVSAISAHGTGTPYNDTMEDAAFSSLFDTLPMHCAKPVTGHTLGAAGAIDALVVMQALMHGKLPKTFQRGPQDTTLQSQPTQNALTLNHVARVLSTSSGFGGSNAALLFCLGDAL